MLKGNNISITSLQNYKIAPIFATSQPSPGCFSMVREWWDQSLFSPVEGFPSGWFFRCDPNPMSKQLYRNDRDSTDWRPIDTDTDSLRRSSSRGQTYPSHLHRNCVLHHSAWLRICRFKGEGIYRFSDSNFSGFILRPLAIFAILRAETFFSPRSTAPREKSMGQGSENAIASR